MNRWLRRWHRWLGITVAVLVLELAVSGVLLNHTDDLNLDRSPVRWSGLLSWYGIRAPEKVASFPVGKRWLSQWGQQVFIDDQPILNPPDGPLVGAVSVQGLIALAWPDRVWLLTEAGALVMSWDAASDLSRPVSAIASQQGKLYLRTPQGVMRSDDELLQWLANENEAVPPWAAPGTLPEDLVASITPQYLGLSLLWERVMLDLHSGRLFGVIGVWVVDLAALLMALLAISGLWVWWLGRRARRPR